MTVDDLMQRPYTKTATRGENGIYTARVVEIPGAISEGATAAEALANLDAGLALLFEVMLEDGDPIPEPISPDAYSGQLTVRLTPYLHARAALFAEIEGVSLNRVLNDAVASYVGLRAPAGVGESSGRWSSKPEKQPPGPRRRPQAKRPA